MTKLTNLRLQTQMQQMKQVSQESVEFLSWLKDHVELPEVPGIGNSLLNVIEHNRNMVQYFEKMELSLKQQMKNLKEKKPS